MRARARTIIRQTDVPLLDRLTGAILSLNINTGAGTEVLEQIHKPQNALLHQKMQEKLIGEVVPLISELIEEGNKNKMFHSRYPLEAAEMIIVYSNTAFDELAKNIFNKVIEGTDAKEDNGIYLSYGEDPWSEGKKSRRSDHEDNGKVKGLSPDSSMGSLTPYILTNNRQSVGSENVSIRDP